MPYPITISEISRLTGATRETIIKKVSELTYADGPHQAKLYDSKLALRCILAGPSNAGESPQDRLADKRTEEIELNMEVTRRERIPIGDVEEHNDLVLQNVAGILKAHEGKKITAELIQELFAELRRMEEVLTEYCRRQPSGETPSAEITLDDPMF